MLQRANLCGNLLDKKATHIRKRILEIIYGAKGGHIGGSLSSVDILTSLYFFRF